MSGEERLRSRELDRLIKKDFQQEKEIVKIDAEKMLQFE